MANREVINVHQHNVEVINYEEVELIKVFCCYSYLSENYKKFLRADYVLFVGLITEKRKLCLYCAYILTD